MKKLKITMIVFKGRLILVYMFTHGAVSQLLGGVWKSVLISLQAYTRFVTDHIGCNCQMK